MSASARGPFGKWLRVAIVVSLAVSLTPWAQAVLYPFKLFTTWAHECGHALATVMAGGRVASIVIDSNTSGLTKSLVPAGRVAGGLVASAGYLGAAVVGCLLLSATRVDKWARGILFTLGAVMLVTIALWMRNAFSIGVVLAWSLALIALARRGTGNAPRFVLSLLAVQVALNSVYDIRVLFLVDGGPSDAATMARLFLLPPWLWAAVWMLTSVVMLVATLRITRAR